MSLWNAERVSRWLRNDIHLPEYAEAFAKEEVTGQLLLMLTYEDLRNELGVESNLHRKKILRGVELARAEEEEDAIEEVSTRILGRRTAPFPPFLIPYRVPHGFTPRSWYKGRG